MTQQPFSDFMSSFCPSTHCDNEALRPERSSPRTGKYKTRDCRGMNGEVKMFAEKEAANAWWTRLWKSLRPC